MIHSGSLPPDPAIHSDEITASADLLVGKPARVLETLWIRRAQGRRALQEVGTARSVPFSLGILLCHKTLIVYRGSTRAIMGIITLSLPSSGPRESSTRIEGNLISDYEREDFSLPE